MRVIFSLVCLVIVSGCATDDAVSERVYGQQLICHKGHTRAVSTADMFVHQDHGDAMGPCPEKP